MGNQEVGRPGGLPMNGAQEVSAVPVGIPDAVPFARQWWAFSNLKSQWEDDFVDLMTDPEDYDRLGTDDYDSSLEIRGANNDWRLSEVQQRFLSVSGFGKVYVNHKDGWETHYTFNWRNPVFPVRGWRRRYISEPSCATTRVLAGDEDNGYFEISYWPEGWNSPGCADWLKTGYMRIVPDPLDPFAQGTEAGTATTGTGVVHDGPVANGDAP